jgi:ESCRT-II complex subunit VPS25
LWESLITAFLRHLGKFQINIIDSLESPLFYNRTISRRLTEMNLRTVLDFMVSTGHAEWEDEFRVRCRILWRTYAEWIDLFTNWAVSIGKRNEVFTVYELIENYPDQEFHKLDAHLMNAIFRAGAAMGKVTYRPKATPTESGVKFVPPAK